MIITTTFNRVACHRAGRREGGVVSRLIQSRHTYAGTDQIKIVARGVEQIRINRGLSINALCRELGWNATGYYALMRGESLSENRTRQLRLWVNKYKDSKS